MNTSKRQRTPQPHSGRAPRAAGSAYSLGDPVLDAAALRFDTYGWSGTTVENVARDADLPLADVLRRFPSREHLAMGIFQRVLDRLPDEFADEIDDESTLHERLYTIFANELRLLEPHKAFIRAFAWQSINPTTMLMQAPLWGRYLAYITEQVQLARGRREIFRWVLPSLAATSFVAVHVQLIGYWLLDDSPGSERTHATADAWIGRFVLTLGGRTRTGRGWASASREALAAVTQEFTRRRDAASPGRPRQFPLELRAQLGDAVSTSFVVENNRAKVADISFHVSEFQADDGGPSFQPALEIDPPAVSLKTGEEGVITLSLSLIPPYFRTGESYTGTVLVRSHEDVELALRIHVDSDPENDELDDDDDDGGITIKPAAASTSRTEPAGGVSEPPDSSNKTH